MPADSTLSPLAQSIRGTVNPNLGLDDDNDTEPDEDASAEATSVEPAPVTPPAAPPPGPAPRPPLPTAADVRAAHQSATEGQTRQPDSTGYEQTLPSFGSGPIDFSGFADPKKVNPGDAPVGENRDKLGTLSQFGSGLGASAGGGFLNNLAANIADAESRVLRPKTPDEKYQEQLDAWNRNVADKRARIDQINLDEQNGAPYDTAGERQRAQDALAASVDNRPEKPNRPGLLEGIADSARSYMSRTAAENARDFRTDANLVREAAHDDPNVHTFASELGRALPGVGVNVALAPTPLGLPLMAAQNVGNVGQKAREAEERALAEGATPQEAREAGNQAGTAAVLPELGTDALFLGAGRVLSPLGKSVQAAVKTAGGGKAVQSAAEGAVHAAGTVGLGAATRVGSGEAFDPVAVVSDAAMGGAGHALGEAAHAGSTKIEGPVDSKGDPYYTAGGATAGDLKAFTVPPENGLAPRANVLTVRPGEAVPEKIEQQIAGSPATTDAAGNPVPEAAPTLQQVVSPDGTRHIFDPQNVRRTDVEAIAEQYQAPGEPAAGQKGPATPDNAPQGPGPSQTQPAGEGTAYKATPGEPGAGYKGPTDPGTGPDPLPTVPKPTVRRTTGDAGLDRAQAAAARQGDNLVLSHVSDEEAGRLRNTGLIGMIAKAFGKEVTYFRGGLVGDNGGFQKTEGFAHGDRIFVNVDSDRALHTVFAHEFGHALQVQAPGLYQELTNALLNNANAAGKEKFLRAQTELGYSRAGAENEFVPEVLSEALADPRVLFAAMGKRPGLAAKTHGLLQDLYDHTLGRLQKWAEGGNGSALEAVNHVRQLKAVLSDTFAKYRAEQAKRQAEGTQADQAAYRQDDLKYLLAGPKSTSGESERAAGRGYTSESGEYHHELDDSRSRLRFGLDQLQSGTAAMEKIGQPGMRLSQIWDHPLENGRTLFEEYPELKDVTVAFKNNGKNGVGGSAYGTGHIEINTHYGPDLARTTILHELQHIVDQHEGRQSFGSSVAQEFAKDPAIRRFNEERNALIAVQRDPNASPDEKDEAGFKLQRDYSWNKAPKAGPEHLKAYFANEGERRARAVERRADLTPEQRIAQRIEYARGRRTDENDNRVEGVGGFRPLRPDEGRGAREVRPLVMPEFRRAPASTINDAPLPRPIEDEAAHMRSLGKVKFAPPNVAKAVGKFWHDYGQSKDQAGFKYPLTARDSGRAGLESAVGAYFPDASTRPTVTEAGQGEFVIEKPGGGTIFVADAHTPHPYIESSNAEGGADGIYQAINTWAAQNGKTIIPKTGLSSINELRKTSSTASSAVRHGDPSHVAPYKGQQIGPLIGDPEHDTGRHFLAEARQVRERLPELKGWKYFPDTGVFRSPEGQYAGDGKPLTDRITRDIRHVDPGFTAGVGAMTFKRALVTEGIEREAGSKKPATENPEIMSPDKLLYALGKKFGPETDHIDKANALYVADIFYMPGQPPLKTVAQEANNLLGVSKTANYDLAGTSVHQMPVADGSGIRLDLKGVWNDNSIPHHVKIALTRWEGARLAAAAAEANKAHERKLAELEEDRRNTELNAVRDRILSAPPEPRSADDPRNASDWFALGNLAPRVRHAFGESVVRHDDGRPIDVVHNGVPGINVFDFNRQNVHDVGPAGLYTAPADNEYDSFNKGGRYRGYIDVRNPITPDTPLTKRFYDAFTNEFGSHSQDDFDAREKDPNKPGVGSMHNQFVQRKINEAFREARYYDEKASYLQMHADDEASRQEAKDFRAQADTMRQQADEFASIGKRDTPTISALDWLYSTYLGADSLINSDLTASQKAYLKNRSNEILRELGYDGIIKQDVGQVRLDRNKLSIRGSLPDAGEIVALSNKQFKLAQDQAGRTNNGNFDLDKDDIQFARAKKQPDPDAAVVKRPLDELVRMANEQAHFRNWYRDFRDDINAFFGPEHAATFKKFLAVTSAGSEVKTNVGLALKAFEQHLLGLPFEGYTPSVIANLERVARGDRPKGPKINEFYDAVLSDDGSGRPIDRHITRLLFGEKYTNPSDAQIQVAKATLRDVANQLGWTDDQTQAALWAAKIVESKKTPGRYNEYLKTIDANPKLDPTGAGAGYYTRGVRALLDYDARRRDGGADAAVPPGRQFALSATKLRKQFSKANKEYRAKARESGGDSGAGGPAGPSRAPDTVDPRVLAADPAAGRAVVQFKRAAGDRFTVPPDSDEAIRAHYAGAADRLRAFAYSHFGELPGLVDGMLRLANVQASPQFWHELIQSQPDEGPVRGPRTTAAARQATDYVTGQQAADFTPLQRWYASQRWKLNLLGADETYEMAQREDKPGGFVLDPAGHMTDFSPDGTRAGLSADQRRLSGAAPLSILDKLSEARASAGFEESRTLGELGVSHKNFPAAVAAFDAYFGPDKWVLKSYDRDASAGQGVWFPEKVRRMLQTEADGGVAPRIAELAGNLKQYGLRLVRDGVGKLVGIKTTAPNETRTFDFDRAGPETDQLPLYGDALSIATELGGLRHQEANFKHNGRLFVQKRLDVYGEGDRSLSSGPVGSNEARVHVMVAPNGDTHVIPYATWIRDLNQHWTPNAIITDKTREIEAAAHHAVATIPKDQRRGAVFGVDVINTKNGWRPVELNPATQAGMSGYLMDHPLTQDAYVSAMRGELPLHAQAGRLVLAQKAAESHFDNTPTDTKSLFFARAKVKPDSETVRRFQTILGSGENRAYTVAENISRHVGLAIPGINRGAAEARRMGEGMFAMHQADGRMSELVAQRARIEKTDALQPGEKVGLLRAFDSAITHYADLQPAYQEVMRRMDLLPQMERANGIDLQSAAQSGSILHKNAPIGTFRNQAAIAGIGKSGFAFVGGDGHVYSSAVEAAEAGVRPRSTDLRDLVGERAQTLLRQSQGAQTVNALTQLYAPDGKQVAINTAGLPRQNGRLVIPPGYVETKLFGAPVLIHGSFANLADMYEAPSMLRTGPLRALLGAAAFAKHGTLALDLIHGARMALYGMSNKVNPFSLGRGLAAARYADSDLPEAVKLGLVKQRDADWARNTRDVTNLLLAHGYNAAKNQIAVDRQLLDLFPGIGHIGAGAGYHVGDRPLNVGGVNLNPLTYAGKGVAGVSHFIFDQLTRSIMQQAGVARFESNLKRFNGDRNAAARQTARELNEKFGSLGTQSWVKSATMRDALSVLMLASPWVESQLRSEARATGQLLASPYELARGRRPGSEGISRLGLLAGLALVAQAANFATYGQPTWVTNKDDGPEHMFDFRMRGLDKEGPGAYYVSPFAFPFEYLHTILGKGRVFSNAPGILKGVQAAAGGRGFGDLAQAVGRTAADVGVAAEHTGANKLSPLGRSAGILVTGNKYARFGGPSDSVMDTRHRLLSAGLAPLPIPILSGVLKDPAILAALRATRIGQPLADFATRHQFFDRDALQKQALSSLTGQHTEPVPDDVQRIRALARQFKPPADKAPGAESAYNDLRQAVQSNNQQALDFQVRELLEAGHKPKAVLDAFKPKPYTDRQNEAAFFGQLTPDQRALYQRARSLEIGQRARVLDSLTRALNGRH